MRSKVATNWLLPLISVVALHTASCASIWHLEDVVTRVSAVETGITDMQEAQTRNQDKLQNLRDDIVTAEETLRRSGAHMGDDLESIKLETARLKSAADELRFNLSRASGEVKLIKRALGERLGITNLEIPEDLINNPDKLIDTAQKAFDAKDDRKATEYCDITISRYPDGIYAARATMLLGELAFRTGNYASAVREFQRVHNYSKSVKGARGNKALLRIGETLLKQNNCKKTIEIYKFLVESAPKSAEAKTAKKRVRKLKKSCK